MFFKKKKEVHHLLKLRKNNCEKLGHQYEIIRAVPCTGFFRQKTISCGDFFIECRRCKKREVLSEAKSMNSYYWATGDVSLETYDKINKEIKETIQKWKEEEKKEKKSKRGRKCK
jgi:hypothetical protein